MATRIDVEPVPRLPASAHRRRLRSDSFIALPRDIRRPQVDFFDVLDGRRSGTGGHLPPELLSSFLWHSTRLRDRRPGRFGIGRESRSAPSCGGLHSIRLIILPLDDEYAGIYDDHRHGLMPIGAEAVELNRASIASILDASRGTTIQFAADADLVSACYENSGSLIWRDSGALAATMCLVATALEMAATPVGRTGDSIVQAARLPNGFIGAGAVHLGSRRNPPTLEPEDQEGAS